VFVCVQHSAIRLEKQLRGGPHRRGSRGHRGSIRDNFIFGREARSQEQLYFHPCLTRAVVSGDRVLTLAWLRFYIENDSLSSL